VKEPEVTRDSGFDFEAPAVHLSEEVYVMKNPAYIDTESEKTGSLKNSTHSLTKSILNSTLDSNTNKKSIWLLERLNRRIRNIKILMFFFITITIVNNIQYLLIALHYDNHPTEAIYDHIFYRLLWIYIP